MEVKSLPTSQQLKKWDWTISETLSSHTEMAANWKKVIQSYIVLRLSEGEWKKYSFLFVSGIEYAFAFLWVFIGF